MKRRWLSFSLMLAFLPTLAPDADGVEGMPEYVMKAAFLYNFALFTEWPDLPGSTLNLCILGHPPLGDALDKIEGKQVYSRALAVSYLTNLNNLKNCQILYVDSSESAGVEKVLQRMDTKVLTVTDSPEVMRQGFMIGMLTENRHIALEINLTAAKHAELNISSKLLRLAKTVY